MRKATRWFIVAVVFGTLAAVSEARPLLTEEPDTLGRLAFETRISLAYRQDEFGSPRQRYTTTVFPVEARLGLNDKLDLGVGLTYLSHSLDTGGAKYNGSLSGRVDPQLKYRFNDRLALKGVWHVHQKEDPAAELPIANGNDFELLAALRLPVTIPVIYNIGYIWRDKYQSSFGVLSVPSSSVSPGNIFENKLSLELPLPAHIGFLVETAYYTMDNRKINGIAIENSAGAAWDVLTGVTWGYESWNIGAGVAFGLLDERHTSFDLEHGAGDVLYKMAISYKLIPKKPTL